MSPLRARSLLCVLPLLISPVLARADTGYAFTVTQATSSLTYTFNASAPFGSGGTPTVYSTLVGADDTTLPAAEQTRTHLGLSCSGIASTVNDPVHISGAITASGSASGATAPHPGGTFSLGLNTAAGVCRLQDLNINLVATGSISAAASLSNFTYQSFCAVNPGCTAFYLIPITLPVGNIGITSLLAQQTPGVPDAGTLTPVAGSPNTWTFTVTTNATVTPTITFSGAPLAAAPQILPITLTGTVAITGNTATITNSTTQLNYAPPAAAPGLQAPTPFTIPAGSPLCSGINIVLTLNILSTTITNNTTATINAAGPRFNCKCDINSDGAVNIQDIFDFLNYWFASNPIADFNGGGLSTQDIFDFLNCWFVPPVGC